MIRYFVRPRDNPAAPNYGEVLAVFRFDPLNGIADKWNAKTREWEWNPHVIEATGLGGTTDFQEVTEDEAMRHASWPILLTPVLRRLVDRGGEGSGHRGHAGRPGERGGSLPGEGGGREPGLRSASELLQVPRTARWQPVRDAAEAINEVHGLPRDLPTLNVVEVKFGTQRLGRLIVDVNRSTGEVKVRNLGVQLPREGEEKTGISGHPALTTAHEFGHYLDWTVFGTKSQPSGDWGDMVGRPQQGSRGLWYQGEGDGSLTSVLTAIKESDVYSQLENFKSVSLPWPGDESGAKLVYDYQTTRYLREPEELFARGYAQWVAERSGNEDMLMGIENYRAAARAGHAPQAWDAEDFEPIGKAFDDLFRGKGWR